MSAQIQISFDKKQTYSRCLDFWQTFLMIEVFRQRQVSSMVETAFFLHSIKGSFTRYKIFEFCKNKVHYVFDLFSKYEMLSFKREATKFQEKVFVQYLANLHQYNMQTLLSKILLFIKSSYIQALSTNLMYKCLAPKSFWFIYGFIKKEACVACIR